MSDCPFAGWSVCGMSCVLPDPVYLDGRPQDGRCFMCLLGDELLREEGRLGRAGVSQVPVGNGKDPSPRR